MRRGIVKFVIAMAAILLATACSSVRPEDGTAPATAVEEASDSSGSDVRVVQGHDEPLSPGRYLSESTGVPVTFLLEDEWSVVSVGPGHLLVTLEDRPDAQDRTVSFIRPSALSSPEAPGEAPEDQLGWPITDLDGWLDDLIDGVEISDRELVEFGGREAVRFTAEVSDTEACGSFGEYCAAFVTNHFAAGWAFNPGFRSTVFWVNMGDDLAPLAAIVGSRPDDVDWQITAEGLLNSVEFGDPGPHPVSSDNVPLWEQGVNTDEPVPAGLRWFPTFGGFSLVLDQDRQIIQAGGYFLVVTSGDSQGDVEIWRAQSGPGEQGIDDTDDLVAVLEQISAAVEEVGSSTHPLGNAREFEVTASGNTFDPDLSVRTEPGELWFTPSAARLWVFETERGVIVVSAESFLQDLLLDDMIELAETVVLPSAELTAQR